MKGAWFGGLGLGIVALWAPVSPLQAAQYVVAPEQSQVRILVYRAGALAKLGHNHVVSATGFQGTVDYRSDTPLQTTLSLRIPVAGLRVDEPHQRRAVGPPFTGEIEPQDAQATRENMLGPAVLDAARYPEVLVRTLSISGAPPHYTVRAEVQVRGVEQQVELPVTVRADGVRLQAAGTLEIAQSGFGIEPLRVAFGSIAVRDVIEVRFILTALRNNADEQ